MLHHGWTQRLALLTWALGLLHIPRAGAAIIPAGDVNLGADPGGTTYVGNTANGTLNIDSGDTLNNAQAFIGYTPGGIGAATITGAGTRWNVTNGVDVGSLGRGTLTIEGGAQVVNYLGYIGYEATASGTATVRGNGSTWTNSYHLYVGKSGSGMLTVSDGGQVITRTLYASPNDLAGNGTITANGVILDTAIVFDKTHGATQSIPFGTGGTLNMVINGSGGMGAGYKGTGSLLIADGLKITSSGNGSYLGYHAGSSGTATLRGTNTSWSGYSLHVGNLGSGSLSVEAGARVSSMSAYLGYETGSDGRAIVTGPWSRWTSSGQLYVGRNGRGWLTIADSAYVTAEGARVNSQSSLHFHVSSDRMLRLGGSGVHGTLVNNGAVAFYADAFLASGTYVPIVDALNGTMTWSGSGTYTAIGGIWDNTAKTFTVAPATPASAGEIVTLSTAQRLLITHDATGQRAGASFGALSANSTCSATPTSQDQIDLLRAMLNPGEEVLSAWDFSTNFAGPETLLSFPIGTGAQNLRVWHRDADSWSAYAPPTFNCDSSGTARFSVSSFSGYAVTGTVPEPSGLVLMALVCMSLIRRRMAAA